MKKIAKRIGIGLAVLVAIVGIGVGVIFAMTSQDFDKTYDVDVPEVSVPSDQAKVAWGKHVLETRGCQDCHGAKMQGNVIMDNPAMGTIAGSNLTSGEGGVAQDYSDEDWVRAIRHSIGPDGKPLIFMPSHEYFGLGEKDLGSMVAYLKSLPPVDNTPPAVAPGPVARMLYLKGDLPMLVSADMIDHEKPLTTPPKPGPTKDYGKYMAQTCRGCHGDTFSGGKIPGMPPDFPAASNLTYHQSGLKSWSKQEFMTALRTGKTPDGKKLNPKHMPWKITQKMNDDEISAMYKYFKSLEPIAMGNR
jgi:mono/diheme cytochrome c family protein